MCDLYKNEATGLSQIYAAVKLDHCWTAVLIAYDLLIFTFVRLLHKYTAPLQQITSMLFFINCVHPTVQ